MASKPYHNFKPQLERIILSVERFGLSSTARKYLMSVERLRRLLNEFGVKFKKSGRKTGSGAKWTHIK